MSFSHEAFTKQVVWRVQNKTRAMLRGRLEKLVRVEIENLADEVVREILKEIDIGVDAETFAVDIRFNNTIIQELKKWIR